MNKFPNEVGEGAQAGFNSTIRVLNVEHLGNYLMFKAFARSLEGQPPLDSEINASREQASNATITDEISDDQIAFLADIKTRLLEELIVDGELPPAKRIQLQALRAFFDSIRPMPPYKDQEKIRAAIEVLRRKARSK